jgi:ParB family transcriptional regulator, chromosome partitioning protein
MSETPPRSFRRRGLGRGLDALLASERELAGDDAALISVAPGEVRPNPEQPRRSFAADELAALADSIRDHGLLHPIVVQRDADGYRLVAGERRLRAAQQAGLNTIPAVLRASSESSREPLELALVENLLRSDLNPIEEATAYARLADGFGLSHEAIAVRLGRSRPSITNAIRLLALAASVQAAVASGRITAGHARALLAVDDPARQEALAAEIERATLTVRETERLVQTSGRRPRHAAGQGDTVRAEPGSRREARLSPDDLALQRGFEAALGMPVELQRRASGGGRLVVDFADDADLDALYRAIGGPQL